MPSDIAVYSRRIPVTTGFNVEVKYPTPEKEEEIGMRAPERNELVDSILQVSDT